MDSQKNTGTGWSGLLWMLCWENVIHVMTVQQDIDSSHSSLTTSCAMTLTTHTHTKTYMRAHIRNALGNLWKLSSPHTCIDAKHSWKCVSDANWQKNVFKVTVHKKYNFHYNNIQWWCAHGGLAVGIWCIVMWSLNGGYLCHFRIISWLLFLLLCASFPVLTSHPCQYLFSKMPPKHKELHRYC